jgi:hypothetical protein
MKPPDEIPATAVFVLSTLYAPSALRLRTARCWPSGRAAGESADRPPDPEHPAARAATSRESATNRGTDERSRMKTSSPDEAILAKEIFGGHRFSCAYQRPP